MQLSEDHRHMLLALSVFSHQVLEHSFQKDTEDLEKFFVEFCKDVTEFAKSQSMSKTLAVKTMKV